MRIERQRIAQVSKWTLEGIVLGAIIGLTVAIFICLAVEVLGI